MQKKIHKLFLPILFVYMGDLFFQDNVNKEKKIEYFCHTYTMHLIQ